PECPTLCTRTLPSRRHGGGGVVVRRRSAALWSLLPDVGRREALCIGGKLWRGGGDMNTKANVIVAEVAETCPRTLLGNLPCPFCGSVNLSLIVAKSNGHGWVQCESCAASGPAASSEATAE